MCLKDDIKFAQNSMNITLSSINDENPNTKDTDSSNFTITLPPHPNPKNYKQALVQLQSLHCPPLSVNPLHMNALKTNLESSIYGVQIDGLGLMNSYISGATSNIVGMGSATSEINQIDTHMSRCSKDVLEHGTTIVTNTDGVREESIDVSEKVITLSVDDANFQKLRHNFAINRYDVVDNSLPSLTTFPDITHDGFVVDIIDNVPNQLHQMSEEKKNLHFTFFYIVRHKSREPHSISWLITENREVD